MQVNWDNYLGGGIWQTERKGGHVKGHRSALANRLAAIAAAERKTAFMARYRVAMGKRLSVRDKRRET